MSSTQTLRSGALEVTLSFSAERLTAIDLPAEVPEDLTIADLDGIHAQLADYECALDHGGAFIRKVWERMRSIPRGSVLTYGELAAEVQNARACRAVGQACATNRLLLMVPCHRVESDSGLGGFRLGLEWKRKLLELEAHC
jgi:O-6-methylguanine DNA methyltransferase